MGQGVNPARVRSEIACHIRQLHPGTACQLVPLKLNEKHPKTHSRAADHCRAAAFWSHSGRFSSPCANLASPFSTAVSSRFSGRFLRSFSHAHTNTAASCHTATNSTKNTIKRNSHTFMPPPYHTNRQHAIKKSGQRGQNFHRIPVQYLTDPIPPHNPHIVSFFPPPQLHLAAIAPVHYSTGIA